MFPAKNSRLSRRRLLTACLQNRAGFTTEITADPNGGTSTVTVRHAYVFLYPSVHRRYARRLKRINEVYCMKLAPVPPRDPVARQAEQSSLPKADTGRKTGRTI